MKAEVISMTQVNFRIDDDVKKRAEQTLAEMGLSMSAAINIFLIKVAREKRIPFEISADPFYSEENMKQLSKIVTEINSGRAKLVEHDLIEVD